MSPVLLQERGRAGGLIVNTDNLELSNKLGPPVHENPTHLTHLL